MDKSDIPKIIHKYISLFDNEEAYDAAFSNFEEVNWSAIKPSVGSEETPDKYRASRRLSNMYRKNNPPTYKFDDINDFILGNKQIVEIQDDGTKKIVIKETNIYADAAYIAKHNTNGNIVNNFTPDVIRKVFFLEIVWGVFGWEWHDYEKIIGINEETEENIIEILKGGNLYLIKNIETVPSIIDGYRLQHINDFLNTQLKVKRVEGFDTRNLVAANRAFKRGFATSTGYPKRHWNEILECHFVDGYNREGQFVAHPFGYQNTLSELLEADGLFYNNKIYMYEGNAANSIPFTIPNITNIDRLYAYGAFTDNLKFKMPAIRVLTNAFLGAIFPQAIINLNDIFVDETLNNISDFSSMLGGVSFTGYASGIDNTVTVVLDLTNSTVDSADIINLSHFIEMAGPSELVNSSAAVANSRVSIDLNFKNKVNLDYAFQYLIGDKLYSNAYKYGDDQNNYHRIRSFEKMSLDIHNKEAYIVSIIGGFSYNRFIETIPMVQVPNNDCDDSYIYRGSIFSIPVSYNFLNGNIASPREQGYGQFNDCTINDSYTFSNIQGLDRVEFCGIKFGDSVPAADRAFRYVVQNQNDTTYRYFDMCDSMFTSMPAQNIYIDTMRMFNAEDRYSAVQGRVNPFYGCSQFTDLSNVHLYYKTHDSNAIQRYNFLGCTNMTKTPHIHLVDTSTYADNMFTFGEYRNNIPYGLQNLTEINLEYLENTEYSGISANNTEISCQGCTNLVYLRIGTQTSGFKIGVINLEGCVNLDIPTLVASLNKWYKGHRLRIPGVIWDDIVQNYPTTATHCMDIAVIEDIR